MKISKLFHWLYATLMFLPFIFLLPTLAYYGFNEHATNTETTTINYKYQSNDVNTLDDLVEGNIYRLEEFEFSEAEFGSYTLDILHITNFDVDTSYLIFKDLNIEVGENFSVFYENTTLDFYFYDSGACLSASADLTDYFIYFYDFIFIAPTGSDFTNFVNDLQDFGVIPQYTDYNVIESVDLNTDNTITGQVSRAWDSVWNLPLFSWTHTSFVSEPFTYITGLFGMSADNPFNYVVTYFVSISVCWLVFDFLMYVPNLAHRWLDKGALE